VSGGLTDVPGLLVGHATDLAGLTGCTAVLCPSGAVAGVEVRGWASGVAGLDLLDPRHLTDRIHGVVLAGGSAFGLEALFGAMAHLEAQGVGFATPGGVVPLVVGEASAIEVSEVIERLWGGPETLIVISSDLSHYHPYAIAQQLDRNTSDAIEQLRGEDLDYESACGRVPVSGLLQVARRRGLTARTIDLRNSGDTAGPRDRVVGYGAYLIE